ncbi:MAG TPA: hypothetical protein VLB82_09970 [Thermodesulfobacteriota bacterium]|nr:hypothetical protein [Thermodesulfobacteriota bacterium]
MKTITEKQSEAFVKGVCKGLLEIGAIKVEDKISTFRTFELDTIVGKLTINVDTDNVHCYTVFSKFEDVEKAKEKFDCNQFSGKYNFHRGKSTLFSIPQMIEFALMKFEATLPKELA